MDTADVPGPCFGLCVSPGRSCSACSFPGMYENVSTSLGQQLEQFSEFNQTSSLAYCRELHVILFPVVLPTDRQGRVNSLDVTHVLKRFLAKPIVKTWFLHDNGFWPHVPYM